MKKIFFLACISTALISCKKQVESSATITEPVIIFEDGETISAEGAIDKSEMLAKFKTMQEGDTISVKFKSTILSVCQKKGCWMNMDLEGEKDAFIRFKDYEFFVPLNATEHKTIVEGKAYLSIISVNELKHYAKDAGQSENEIEAITEPKITYTIMAHGVQIYDTTTNSETVN